MRTYLREARLLIDKYSTALDDEGRRSISMVTFLGVVSGDSTERLRGGPYHDLFRYSERHG